MPEKISKLIFENKFIRIKKSMLYALIYVTLYYYLCVAEVSLEDTLNKIEIMILLEQSISFIIHSV